MQEGQQRRAPWKQLSRSLRKESWLQRTLELGSSSVILLCCLNTPFPLHSTAPELSWDTCQAAEPLHHLPALPSPEEVQLQSGMTQLRQSTDTSPDARHNSPLIRAFLLFSTLVHCCCLREGAGTLPEEAGMHSLAGQEATGAAGCRGA